MQIMAADNLKDIESLRPLFDEMGSKTDRAGYGIPRPSTDLSLARLTHLVDQPNSIILIALQAGSPVGYMALHAQERVATECGFYMQNFAHTRQLVDAAKQWAAAQRCTALKLTSAQADEAKRRRIFNLLHKRGGFVKYAEVYTVKI